MKKIFVFSSVLLYFSLLVFGASAFENTKQINASDGFTFWARTYGDTRSNYLEDISSTSDGGYIATAFVSDNSSPEAGTWVMKFDDQGNVSWQDGFENYFFQDLSSVIQTSDGGYIAAGATTRDSLTYGEDAWIIKFVADGTVDWQKWYGGDGWDQIIQIVEIPNNGFIAVGYTESFGAGDKDIWVLKLSSLGTVQWQKTYGGANWDLPWVVILNSDNSFVICGETSSFGAGSYDAWILKLNPDGTIVWQKTFGGILSDRLYSGVATSDEKYIFSGYLKTNQGVEQGWILKLNDNGTIAWQKTYGSDNDLANVSLESIVNTGSNGYLAAGYTTNFGAGNEDMWLLKTDTEGNMLWEKTYGGTERDFSKRVLYTGGNVLLAGRTLSFGVGDNDLWLLKLNSNGEIGECNVIGTASSDVAEAQAVALETSVSDQVSSAQDGMMRSNQPDSMIVPSQQMCYAEIPTLDVFLPVIFK